MKTTAFLANGAVESCATPEQDQSLTARCGPNGAIDAQREFSTAPAPTFPKLRGLKWRSRADGGRAAYWIPPTFARRSGYPIKTHLLWAGREPTTVDAETILRGCVRMNRQLRDWVKDPTRIRPSPQMTRRGEVYFARCGNRIKIGFSAKVVQRIRTLQIGSAEPIELLGSMAGSHDRERAIHLLFRDLRLSGEWFAAAPSLLSYIRDNCTGGQNMKTIREAPTHPVSPARRDELLRMAKATRAKIRHHPKLAEPIKRAACGLRKMAGGTASPRIMRDTQNEIECLARVFKMVEGGKLPAHQNSSH